MTRLKNWILMVLNPPPLQPGLQRKIIAAFAIPFIAFFIQWSLWSLFKPLELILFYPAVFLSGWIGGLRAGIIATVISAFLSWYFFIILENPSELSSPRHLIAMTIFILIGSLLSLFCERIAQTEWKLRSLSERLTQELEEVKLTEAALKKANSKLLIFTALIDNSVDFIGVADPNGKPIYVNPAGRRMVGLDNHVPIVDTKIIDYYAPAHRDFALNVILQKMQTFGIWQGETYFHNFKTQEAIPVSDTHFKILSPTTGELLGFGTVTRDITERKKYEQSLADLNRSLECRVRERTSELTKEIFQRKESERIYRAIGESIDYGVWICAPDGRNTYASESFLKLVGMTQEECSEFGWGKVLHPDDAIRTISAWKECVRTQGKWDIQHRFRGVDGRWHPILARGVPVQNDQGQVICWAGINLDISALKESEESLKRHSDALQKSEAKFRKIFESDLIGLSFWNFNGDIIDANAAYLSSVGYSQEDLEMGRINWKKLSPTEWNEFDLKTAAQLKQLGSVPTFEKEFLRKDGSRIPLLVGLALLEGISDIHGIAFTVDISERRKAEKERDRIQTALEEANEMLRKQMIEKSAELDAFKVLAESIPQLCWIAHRDGFIFWYNQRWYQYTGTTPQEMEGWGWKKVHDPKLLPDVLERWKTSIQTGIPFEMEFPLRAANGRFRWFLTRVLPFRDSHNQIARWFGTNTDIEDQKQALYDRENLLKEIQIAKDQLELRVQERTRDLLKSNQELEQFAYIASHDLQTPLRHITSYVQLLISKVRKTSPVDPQTEKWITYIVNGTQQMKLLITDLLTYSRVGRLDVTFTQVDLNQLVSEILEIFKELIRKTEAKIHTENLPRVQAVKSQLHQLLQNLIENAIKFRKPGLAPVISIQCQDRSDSWEVSISDNGIGFNPHYAVRIFEMFQRLHTSTEYPGTGIGLAVCRKIIEFHKGKIWVKSEEGVGSTFYFSLPKKEEIPS